MAQTKRKRRTKHRGTAAGTIESRGRTGRPPTPDERKKQARASLREQRLNTPPTWSGSLKRAALAAAFIFLFMLLTSRGSHRVAAALIFAVFALALYIPGGYYLELFMFRRRQRKRAAAATTHKEPAK
jgi:Flp pilus assembly protein TadB